jgi:hypothetical protein
MANRIFVSEVGGTARLFAMDADAGATFSTLATGVPHTPLAYGIGHEAVSIQ